MNLQEDKSIIETRELAFLILKENNVDFATLEASCEVTSFLCDIGHGKFQKENHVYYQIKYWTSDVLPLAQVNIVISSEKSFEDCIEKLKEQAKGAENGCNDNA